MTYDTDRRLYLRIAELERALQEMLSLYDRDEFADIRAVLAGTTEKQTGGQG